MKSALGPMQGKRSLGSGHGYGEPLHYTQREVGGKGDRGGARVGRNSGHVRMPLVSWRVVIPGLACSIRLGFWAGVTGVIAICNVLARPADGFDGWLG